MKKYISSKYLMIEKIELKQEIKTKLILYKWHKNYKMETKITKINRYKMN